MALSRKSKTLVGMSTVGRSITKMRLYNEELIKQDLMNQFMTRKGERVMLPEYGCIIWDLLFEQNISGVKDLIINDCTRIIEEDTRVELLNISVTETDYTIQVNMVLNYKPYSVVDNLYVSFQKQNNNFEE